MTTDTMPWWVDLNCDMGESEDPAMIDTDLGLLEIVTSANIACGGHAGDEISMARTVRSALARAVAIGAHPGYADRANFGRTACALSPGKVESTVEDQIAALARVADRLGARLSHVKPHGALYHAAASKPDVARAIARAARRIDPSLVLVGLAGSIGLRACTDLGSVVAAEAFADRLYEPDGSLRPRDKPGAVLDAPQSAVMQAVEIVRRRSARASDGSMVAVCAQTICIHSDTPGAVALAAAVRRGLIESGVIVRRLTG